MERIEELDYVVKYFKETFNDKVFYGLDPDNGDFIINTEPEPFDSIIRAKTMYDYNANTKTLQSLFNNTLKMLSPYIDLSNNTPGFVEYWKDHYLNTFNFPIRLYKALQEAVGPNKRIIDSTVYSIPIKFNRTGEQISLFHEIVFTMKNDNNGSDSFIITLDEKLKLIDVILYENSNLFIRHSKNMDIAQKQKFFICALGALLNKDFAQYFNKENIDYSDRSIELLTILTI